MMGRVKYPFWVKHDGRYYAPYEVIGVEDVAAALTQGATAVPEGDKPESKPRKAKKQSE